MKKKLVLVAVMIFTATIFVYGLIFLAIEQSNETYTAIVINDESPIDEISAPTLKDEPVVFKPLVPSQAPSAAPSIIPNPTNTPVPTVTANVDNESSNLSEGFASITISTIKRTRSYEIMPDVNENTLKKNIGWLPSSSLPGQEGLCILMGHRDTDFSILKYAEVGDEFIISMSGVDFKYSVSAIEIVNSDSELRFKAHSGSTLLLVTCYPFRYSGHAPQKILFYAEKIH